MCIYIYIYISVGSTLWLKPALTCWHNPLGTPDNGVTWLLVE